MGDFAWKVDRDFLLESYSHPGAVACYGGAVGRVGLWACEKEFFGRHLPRNGRILDLGCGAGRTTIGLHARGYRDLLGVDLAPVLIRCARAQAAKRGLKIPFRVGDACALPLESASFDGALFSFNGLMTIPKRARRIAALREIRRVLRPGGRFVFTTHDRFDSPAARTAWRKERALWRAGRQDPELHEFGDVLLEELGRPAFVHIPDRREILDCLGSAGLDPVEDEFLDPSRESKAVKAFVSSGLRFWAAERRRAQGCFGRRSRPSS